MKSQKTLVLLTLLVFVCSASFAQEEAPKKNTALRFLIGCAFEFGGDEVAKIYFTNSDAQSVKAGQGISGAIGAEYQFPQAERLLLRATVGYKYVTTKADNAHIRLTRVPLHFTANWMAGKKFRLGAGIAMHRSIKFNADGLGENISFKSANGPIFEMAYHGIGISYTAMKYKDDQKNSYSANSFGITISGVVPRRK